MPPSRRWTANAWRLFLMRSRRHTFAVHALLRWYHGGADPQAKLPFLSTYMGHVSPVSTAYYLPFVSALAEAASLRFLRTCGALVTGSPAGERP